MTFLKRWLTGMSIPQEYLCLGLEKFYEPLSIIFTIKGKKDHLDITQKALLLGYKPVIMAILFTPHERDYWFGDEACFSFNKNEFKPSRQWHGFYTDKLSLARLALAKIQSRDFGDIVIAFYRGVEGCHSFILRRHQLFNNLIERWRKKPTENVSLPDNLYDQVRIAYSVPRLISLVTVFDGSKMNLFPTDLHGAAGSDFYLSSLRIGGEACNQVQQHKRIVISDVDATQYKTVYSLGKRHMRSITEVSQFELSHEYSGTFRFPLPRGVGRYRELEWIDYFDVGIHRIFIYKVIHDQWMKKINPLVHIHCYYVQWLTNNGFLTNYLLR